MDTRMDWRTDGRKNKCTDRPTDRQTDRRTETFSRDEVEIRSRCELILVDAGRVDLFGISGQRIVKPDIVPWIDREHGVVPCPLIVTDEHSLVVTTFRFTPNHPHKQKCHQWFRGICSMKERMNRRTNRWTETNSPSSSRLGHNGSRFR